MSVNDHEYTKQLAAAAAELLDDGHHDPSGQEILDRMFDTIPCPPEVVAKMPKRLPRIVNHLRKEPRFRLLIPVTSRYVQDRKVIRKRGLPETMEECLPYVAGRGGGGRAEGIYLPRDSGSVLYVAAEYSRTNKTTGALRAGLERVDAACTNGILTGDQARELVMHVAEDSLPRDPEARARLAALSHDEQRRLESDDK